MQFLYISKKTELASIPCASVSPTRDVSHLLYWPESYCKVYLIDLKKVLVSFLQTQIIYDTAEPTLVPQQKLYFY